MLSLTIVKNNCGQGRFLGYYREMNRYLNQVALLGLSTIQAIYALEQLEAQASNPFERAEIVEAINILSQSPELVRI